MAYFFIVKEDIENIDQKLFAIFLQILWLQIYLNTVRFELNFNRFA
jgi:hypothetical protein